MIFQVTLKDPDTLHDAIAEAVQEQMASMPGMSAEEREAVAEIRREAVAGVAAKWFSYGEYLTIEIDTEMQTATVCPVR